ncbi:MAG: DNA-binding protein [Ramlibacter sp.]|nr:DNA-binding protein [Ramlibacter sp.]
MSIKPIKSEDDRKAAMRRIDVLWGRKDRASRDELEVLGMLVSAYEDEAIPLDDVDPIDMLKFRMEQAGHTQPDLSKLLGSRSRATEILNHKRQLTLPMIRTLHSKWNIPADALIKESKQPRGRKATRTLMRAKKAAKKAAKSSRHHP